MTTQTALLITSLTIGFCAAVFFCVGNVTNSSQKIIIQATPFWDFSRPVASALAAQKAQYMVGAILLIISFSLQLVVLKVPPNKISTIIPSFFQNWLHLTLLVLVITLAVSSFSSLLIYKSTMNDIDQHIKAIDSSAQSAVKPKS